MSTPVAATNLDAATFATWENDVESPATDADKNAGPANVVWSDRTKPRIGGFWYGDSKSPGIKHLRVGFSSPIEVGSVVVLGGGQLSVLKNGAAYPGALDDESQWIPATRLVDGVPSRDEVANDQFALWTLPPGIKTRALRFTHTANSTDNRFGCCLGGAFVLSDRDANLAPSAQVSTSQSNQYADRLNNGSIDGTWKTWENISALADSPAENPVVSPDHPEWIILSWPELVKVSGLEALWAGFSSADVQIYTGAADVHPRDAAETDWQTVKSFQKLKSGYPIGFWPNLLDFGKVVTTRAIRLRLTSPTAEDHPHLVGKTRDGKRVWLGELMALQPLGNASLSSVRSAALTSSAAPHPPIPVKFNLEKAGYVTLVIESADGKRVRNLVSETYFPAGANTVWWDGTNDLGRDVDAAEHGLYRIPAQFVDPGEYRVRGLWRGELGLHYEFSVYNAGTPAWPLPDHTGAWLANHTPPQAALFVPPGNSPTGKAAVLLGCYMTEGRDGLAWVDLDGKKLGGKKWLGGIYSAAPFLARDLGPNATPGIYAYAASAWDGELRLTALCTDGTDKSVLSAPWKFSGANPAEITANAEVNGLAVREGNLVVSLGHLNQLLFVNAKSGQVQGRNRLDDPRGLAFDAAGHLWVLSGTKLLRYASAPNVDALPTPQTVVGAGLEDPHGLAFDARGNIYISDQGKSQQVKVFDGEGKLVRTVGHPGEPQAGPYDPQHMNHPEGITIDSENRLWVAENDFLPKRVSLWSPSGQLIKAFYGPSKYGGGGSLDGGDKSRFYYADEYHGTLEFKLDWATGNSMLASVPYRSRPGDLPLPSRSAAPETAIAYRGGNYLTNCFNSSPTGGSGTAFLFLEKDGVARPVAGAGRAQDWSVLKGAAFKPSWPAGVDLNAPRNNQAFFVWSDNNSDGQVQPNEVMWQAGTNGGVTVMPDLSFCVNHANGSAVQLSPVGLGTEGEPRYDLGKAKVITPITAGPASSGGDQVLVGSDGWTVDTLGIQPFHPYSLSGTKDGAAAWSYPNLWPGLHASHQAAVPDRPGEVIGATRLLGGFVSPTGSDAGQLWAVNGNMGNLYVFTSDGLFVATLFQDVRQGNPWAMPVATRNMPLENITLHDENFWPTWTQTPDGQIYLQDGSNTSLVRIDGLNAIRRLPVTPLRITAADLKGAQDFSVNAEMRRQAVQGRGVLKVNSQGAAPQVNGNLDDWNGASWVDIDRSGVKANFNSNSKPYEISAAVAVNGGKLYAAFKTGNPALLQNTGEMPNAPFKTGGALDIMLGTDPNADPRRSAPVAGDLRLLVTQVKGKTRALIYRAVVPGTQTPVPFSSPWRTINFDEVVDVSNQVELAGSGGNYEISVPLSVLGVKPHPGLTLRGDIGVLRGDGTQTTARTYWSNKSTGITADIPSEAMLSPNLWGEWQF